jgi:hypothetical protein
MASDPSPATRFEWERTLIVLPLLSTTKLVGLTLAIYCDAKTGKHAHPGADRLAGNCDLSDRAVRTHIDILRHLGLLDRTYKGRANQYGRLASEYLLALPGDVLQHAKRWRDSWNEDACYRKAASSSTFPCCRKQTTLLPEAGDALPEGCFTATGSTLPPINHVTTDVYQPKTNIILPAAQSTDRTHEVEEKQLCEVCRGRIARDGECLACRHMNVRSA